MGGKGENQRFQKVKPGSFCEKTYAQVAKLITGPGSNICNECITICNEILATDSPSE